MQTSKYIKEKEKSNCASSQSMHYSQGGGVESQWHKKGRRRNSMFVDNMDLQIRVLPNKARVINRTRQSECTDSAPQGKPKYTRDTVHTVHTEVT